MLWGVAGSFENNSRKVFQNLLFEHLPDSLPNVRDEETLFDYYLHFSDRGVEWKLISLPKWKPPKTIFFSRLLMPTLDSTRASILINLLNLEGSPVLMMGGSGTAKTSSVLMYANKFDSSKMLFHRINFSSATYPKHF